MKRHSSVMTKSAEARLAQVLLQLANEAGEVHSSGIVVDITNERLSSLSDISSFTASRLLSKWERDGKITKERGRVTLQGGKVARPQHISSIRVSSSLVLAPAGDVVIAIANAHG